MASVAVTCTEERRFKRILKKFQVRNKRQVIRSIARILVARWHAGNCTDIPGGVDGVEGPYGDECREGIADGSSSVKTRWQEMFGSECSP
ncbi:MAG: hypothetical protein R3C68_02975 [Myxococcota bacterium]